SASERCPERDMTDRLRGAAAGLGPIRIGDRRRQRHRQRGGRRIDLDVALAGQHRNALAEDRGFGRLALLEHAAATRGERGGDQNGNADMLSGDHVGSYWAGAVIAALASTPRVPAIWTERARSEGGTLGSLAMAA